MKFFYRSERVGKHGQPFSLYKIKTLKDGTDKTSSFAQQDQYTWCGRFLRKTKLDELTQVFNLFKGEVAIVGPRPEEVRNVGILPAEVRSKLLSVKPGLTSLASIFFFDEEKLLQQAQDPAEMYWKFVKPGKILLDTFYIENKCLSLDLVIIWLTIKKIIGSFFKHAWLRSNC